MPMPTLRGPVVTGRPVLGSCDRCGYPVRVGEERRETVHQGTGPGRDVLLHRQLCGLAPSARPRTYT